MLVTTKSKSDYLVEAIQATVEKIRSYMDKQDIGFTSDKIEDGLTDLEGDLQTLGEICDELETKAAEDESELETLRAQNEELSEQLAA